MERALYDVLYNSRACTALAVQRESPNEAERVCYPTCSPLSGELKWHCQKHAENSNFQSRLSPSLSSHTCKIQKRSKIEPSREILLQILRCSAFGLLKLKKSTVRLPSSKLLIRNTLRMAVDRSTRIFREAFDFAISRKRFQSEIQLL